VCPVLAVPLPERTRQFEVFGDTVIKQRGHYFPPSSREPPPGRVGSEGDPQSRMRVNPCAALTRPSLCSSGAMKSSPSKALCEPPIAGGCWSGSEEHSAIHQFRNQKQTPPKDGTRERPSSRLEFKMALLRQCLEQLRAKQAEVDLPLLTEASDLSPAETQWTVRHTDRYMPSAEHWSAHAGSTPQQDPRTQ